MDFLQLFLAMLCNNSFRIQTVFHGLHFDSLQFPFQGRCGRSSFTKNMETDYTTWSVGLRAVYSFEFGAGQFVKVARPSFGLP